MKDIGPDLVAPADIGLRRGSVIGSLLALLKFKFVQPRFQHVHRGGAVAMLRAVILTLHHDVGRDMGDADCGVRLVDVLTPGSRGAVGVNPKVLVLDLDLDIVINHRINPGAGKTGMTTGRAVIGGNTDQPVNAGLRLQPAIGIVT